jgi:hypothetical protein
MDADPNYLGPGVLGHAVSYLLIHRTSDKEDFYLSAMWHVNRFRQLWITSLYDLTRVI